MDFFKSVFTNDPEPSNPQTPRKSMSNLWKNPLQEPQEPERHQNQQEQEENQEFSDELLQNPNLDNTQLPKPSTDGWNFGGLIKTLTSKSEGVLQTYRRDLEEFSSGLKKETAAIRDAASRVVKDLPGSLEVGASVAQESLESVGQVIDDFGSSVWRGTHEIISQGKDALLNADQDDNSDSGSVQNSGFSSLGLSSKRYSSRFEAMVYNMQVDLNTYCQEPEDLDDYNRWNSGFVLEEKGEEIEGICEENGAVGGIILKVVPRIVDYETFWGRYFYKVQKLKQAEDARANLVKRAIEREEEDLSWEVDDEEIEVGELKNGVVGDNPQKNEEEVGEATKTKIGVQESAEEMDGGQKNVMQVEKRDVEVVDIEKKGEILETGKDNSDGKNDARDMVGKENPDTGVVDISGGNIGSSDVKTILEGKNDAGESSKDSDFSVVSSQPSHEEDDLGWDEIEDLGSIDEKKATTNGSQVKVEDLRKRLSAADDDEDLSWDIEDDDPVKP